MADRWSLGYLIENGVISAGDAPTSGCISSDGKNVYVNSSNSSVILIYNRNTLTGTLTLNSTTPIDPDNPVSNYSKLLISQDGKNVYVIGTSQTRIYDRNISTGLLTYSASFGYGGICSAISPDDKNIYFGNGISNAFFVCVRNTGTGLLTYVETFYSIGMTLVKIAISPAGDYLCATDNVSNKIGVHYRNTSNGKISQGFTFNADPIPWLPEKQSPDDLFFSPDGKFIYVSFYESNNVFRFQKKNTIWSFGVFYGGPYALNTISNGYNGVYHGYNEHSTVKISVSPDGKNFYGLSGSLNLPPRYGEITRPFSEVGYDLYEKSLIYNFGVSPQTGSFSKSTEISTGIYPVDIIISADGNSVYVINAGGDSFYSISNGEKTISMFNRGNGESTLSPLPQIISVSPSGGSILGGTIITVTGAYFTGATAVTIGGIADTGFKVVNSTTITAIAPVNVAGPAIVLVTTPNGTNVTDNINLFQYDANALASADVYPSGISALGNKAVRVTGPDFSGTTAVTVGGTTTTNFSLYGSKIIEVLAPPKPLGSAAISVTSQNGNVTIDKNLTYFESESKPWLTQKQTVANDSGCLKSCISPDGMNIYALTFNSNFESKISIYSKDLSTGLFSLNSNTSVGSQPVDICASPDGKNLYVLHVDKISMFYRDALTGSLIEGTSRISTGIKSPRANVNPAAICITPNGKYVYVACNGQGGETTAPNNLDDPANYVSIAMFKRDSITGVLSGNFSMNRDLLFSNAFSLKYYGGQKRNNYGSGINGVYASPDGLRIYISGGGSISALGIIQDQISQLQPAGTISFGIRRDLPQIGNIINDVAISSDSRFVYVNNNDKISIFDCISETTGGSWLASSTTLDLNLGNPSGYCISICISPNDKNVYVGVTLAGYRKIIILTRNVLDGSLTKSNSIQHIIPFYENPENIFVSPDGANVYISILNTRLNPTQYTSSLAVYDTTVSIPTMYSVSPSSGSMFGGTLITITGANFTGATAVTVGGGPVTSFTVVNSTTITATTSAGSAGTASVLVTTAIGTNAANSLFTYVITPPSITSISPSSGSTLGGTVVTITGKGFIGATSVVFGLANATSFTVISANTIIATIAPRFAGGGGVYVTTPTGTSTEGIGFVYAVLPPAVTSISPSSGFVLGGTLVTITGSNFTGTTAVKIGGVSATSIVVVNSTTITAITATRTGYGGDSYPVGSASVLVTTPSGTNVANSLFAYANRVPIITDIFPSSGSTLGGTFIVITGTDLIGVTNATIGGVPVTSLIVVNSTTINAITGARSAGVANAMVYNSLGSGTTAVNMFVYVVIPPTVASVSPSSGSTLGGTSITITGTSFTGATAVTIGGVAATGFTVVNSTTITANTGARSAGFASVLVTTPSGTNSANGLFTYIVVPPTVASVSPSSGSTLGGTSITITGANFTGTTEVTIGNISVNSFIVVNSTTITAIASARSAGTASVLVTTAGGTNSANSLFTYAVVSPTVVSVSPSGGSTLGGTPITVTGTNFTGTTAVTIGGSPVSIFTVVNSTTITATTSARSAGVASVLVTTPSGTNSVNSLFTYAVPSPTVASVSPSSGSTLGGTSITITGTSFSGATAVTIGGSPVSSFIVVNSTTITAIASARSAGTASVLVTTAGGTNSANSLFTYAVVSPTVASVSPSSGSTFGGTSITITGANFTGATAVTIGGISVVSFTIVNSTTITAIVSARSAGTASVLVTTPSGTNGVNSLFTYLIPAPTVASVSPSTGSTLGGTSITITGANFTGATTIIIGGVLASSFTIVNSTTITATIAANVAGIASVLVTTAGGTNSANSLFTYAVLPPTVVGISPSTGFTSGGIPITITGTDLTGATAVTIGGISVTRFTVVNSTIITATIAANVAGIASVLVTTPSGTNDANSLFTYVPAPTVASVSPSSGSTFGGTSITITGANFTGATAVAIGGVSVDSFIVVNSTTITATIAANVAGFASLLVATPSGTNSANSLFEYIVPAPAVSSVSPSGGSTFGGTFITITGTYFADVISVTVGGVAVASFIVVNSTTITAMISSRSSGTAETASVLVTTVGGASNANILFAYIVPAPAVSSVSPSSGSTLGGTPITITGVNLTGATAVSIGGFSVASFIVVNSTTITAISSARSAGTASVLVITAGGGNGTNSLFTYVVPAPTVSSVSPSSGSISGGTSIAITGANLTGATAVTIGGVSVITFTVVNSTTINAKIGSRTAGTASVLVTTAGGTNSANSLFTYVAPPPSITSISPSSGSTLGGTFITINGTNLTGTTAVTIGGVAVTGLTVANSIKAMMPFETVYSSNPDFLYEVDSDFFLGTTYPTSNPVSLNATLKVVKAGHLYISISWPYGNRTNAILASVQVNGVFVGASANVQASDSLMVNVNDLIYLSFFSRGQIGPSNNFLTSFCRIGLTVIGPTFITAITPANVAGLASVLVTTGGGTSDGNINHWFTYVAPAPTVSSVSPSSGSTLGGNSITITGANFTGTTAVTIGGVAVTEFTVVNPTTITATTDANVLGSASVLVTTSSGTNSANSLFTYVVAPPTVSSISPSSGSTLGGTSIAITGSNFTGTTEVTIGGIAVVQFTVVNSTTINATTDANVAGSASVLITTPSGTNSANSLFEYVVTATTVSNVSPSSGSTLGGTSIVITGANFTGTTEVTIGGVAVTEFTVVDSTTINATTDANVAGSASVLVTTPSGTNDANSLFEYIETAPTVSSVFPSGGSTLGGTSITITGTYFSDAIAVTIGGVAVTEFTVVNSTTITATTDANVAGSASVLITTPSGTNDETTIFLYALPAPTVSNVSPSSGSTLGGTSIVITGANFTGTTAVTIGGVAVTEFTVVDSTTITATIDANVAGFASVLVTTPSGTNDTNSLFEYVLVPPVVTSVSPSSGSTLGGTSITITGTYFADATEVTIGGVAVTEFTVVDSTTITATTDANVAGFASVLITTPSGTNEANSLFEYVVTAPTVSSLSPSSGSTLGGTSIAIIGTYFTDATAVTIGGVAVAEFTVVNSTAIVATTSANVVGSASVLVTTPSGTNEANSLFEYVETNPTAVSVSPSSGSISGGTSITITGTYFVDVISVTIGGIAATEFTVVNSTTITATTDANVAGSASVLITTPSGTNEANSFFEYIENAPTVTSVSPSSGFTSGGALITITGTYFADVISVTIGGVAVAEFTVIDSTTITATTDANVAGSASVLVTNSNGTNDANSLFEYVETAPTVLSVSPSGGSTLGGTSIEITGTNFAGTTEVTIGGVAVTEFTVVDSTTITATTDANVAGSASVLVTTPSGTNSANGLFTYIVVPPTVSSVSPSRGSTLGGTSITITGSNFTGATSVEIGGVSVASFTVVNSTTITAITSARSAGSTSVFVTTPSGTNDDPGYLILNGTYSYYAIVNGRPAYFNQDAGVYIFYFTNANLSPFHETWRIGTDPYATDEISYPYYNAGDSGDDLGPPLSDWYIYKSPIPLSLSVGVCNPTPTPTPTP